MLYYELVLGADGETADGMNHYRTTELDRRDGKPNSGNSRPPLSRNRRWLLYFIHPLPLLLHLPPIILVQVPWLAICARPLGPVHMCAFND